MVKQTKHLPDDDKSRATEHRLKAASQPVAGGEKEALRHAGIDILGDVPWGTHFCLFYHTKQDLIDILVPYFKEGLKNNEFCMWVTSEPLNAQDAKKSLKRVVRNIDSYIEKAQIEILDYSNWYIKTGAFEADSVLQGWVQKHDQAIKNGFDGLRLTGNTLWLEKKDWRKFIEYEAVVNSVIGKYKMLAVCTYSLDKCGASEILDVESNHQFAFIKRQGDWRIIQSSERKQAHEQLKAANQQLDASNQQLRATQEELRKLNHDLVERVKELNCLYGLSGLVERRDITLQEIFQALVELIPPAWQYPEIIGARITFENQQFKTNNFRKTAWIQSADIKVYGQKAGTIEVCYLKKRPVMDDGAFLKGERNLLNALAERLAHIIERTNAEQAFHKEHSYLEKLIDYSNVPIIVWDPNFRVTRFNHAFQRLTAYATDEIIGQKLSILFPKASRDASLRNIKRTLGGEYWELVEIPILSKNGEIWLLLWNSANIYAEDGTTLLATIAQGQDITERKQAEEALKATNQQLRASEQQLRAANQQLQANEQQLKAANQQLQANEQQLKAANQQLQASEQQLRASNQQLQANEQQLKAANQQLQASQQQLLAYQGQLKSLASQLTLTEEHERHRVATDLHATIGQSLVISKLQLDTLRASAPSGGDLAKTLNEVCNSLDETVQQTRTLVSDLSSPILYELGFETAVAEWLTEQIKQKHNIKTEFEDDQQPKPLDNDIRVLLFRNVREMLINVVKHAHAGKVKVSIGKVGSEIHVAVEDDGWGFDPKEITARGTKKGGFGLFSIRERLEQLGGHLEINSAPGQGCRVTMTAPLKEENIKNRG